MTAQRYDSGTARVKFRDILEASRRGIDIIIEHYKRPTFVIEITPRGDAYRTS